VVYGEYCISLEAYAHACNCRAITTHGGVRREGGFAGVRPVPVHYPEPLQYGARHALRTILRYRTADAALQWYRDRGLAIERVEQIRLLPLVIVEERASRLRPCWRRWLWGESALAAALGPAAVLVGTPVLLTVLLGWSVDMGWSYGLNMYEERRLTFVEETIVSGLTHAFGLTRRGSTRDLRDWGHVAGTILLWGAGSEFTIADRVMAAVRAEFRRQWEDRSSL
jgi:hypothetical protein